MGGPPHQRGLLFLFLFAHVLDTALVRVSPEAYNEVMEAYKNPIVGLAEAGLVAAVIFHALNGLRIIAVDFWSKGPRLQRQLFWAVVDRVRRAVRAVCDPAPDHRVHALRGHRP